MNTKRSTFIVAIIVIATLVAHAQETNRLFQIKKQPNQEAYQQYVGQRIQFRSAIGDFEKASEVPAKLGIDYTITKITTKSKKVGNDKKENIEVALEFQEVGSKKRIKYKAYNNVALDGLEILPIVSDIPLIIMDKYEAYKKEVLNGKITNERVKESYIITDVYISGYNIGGSLVAGIFYTTKGDMTGHEVKCHDSDAKTACFKKALSGRYIGFLSKVEKPSDPNYRYGTTTTTEDNGLTKYSYVDDMIDILIFTTQTDFNFVLKNISSSTQKVIWNEAVYVDYNGNTSKIMHSGIKYSQKDGDQSATTIIKGSKIEDIACPICNVSYSNVLKKWVTSSMFPSEPGQNVGPIRLMLPIQIKDVVNEYIFEFDVKYVYNHPELLNF